MTHTERYIYNTTLLDIWKKLKEASGNLIGPWPENMYFQSVKAAEDAINKYRSE